MNEHIKSFVEGREQGHKDVIEEVEELREELCKVRDMYSNVCERLWKISNKRRGVSHI